MIAVGDSESELNCFESMISPGRPAGGSLTRSLSRPPRAMTSRQRYSSVNCRARGQTEYEVLAGIANDYKCQRI